MKDNSSAAGADPRPSAAEKADALRWLEQFNRTHAHPRDIKSCRTLLALIVDAERQAEATEDGQEFMWGDRVVQTMTRHRGRIGTYRSKCDASRPNRHTIKWDGRKTTEMVHERGFKRADVETFGGK